MEGRRLSQLPKVCATCAQSCIKCCNGFCDTQTTDGGIKSWVLMQNRQTRPSQAVTALQAVTVLK